MTNLFPVGQFFVLVGGYQTRKSFLAFEGFDLLELLGLIIESVVQVFEFPFDVIILFLDVLMAELKFFCLLLEFLLILP